MRNFMFLAFVILLAACNGNAPANKPKTGTPPATSVVQTTGYEVVNTFRHDPGAFTQGLVFRDGFLYESAGQYGKSTLRKVDLATGKVLKSYSLPEEYFAEGMTILGDKIYQITWQENTAFVYDMNFKLLKELRYSGDGWGLTNDGTHLIMSDGTHVIRFVNPDTFETERTIVLKDEKGRAITQINELEFVKGEIWANIWHSETMGKPNHVARIDPKDGKLLGWINLQGISPEDVARNSENVLNGIAYDAVGDRVFVTGKQWQKLFEIKIKQ